MTAASISSGLKRAAIWFVDRAGSPEQRQSRREAAVAMRVRAVKLLHRLAPGQRRLRRARLGAIAALEAQAPPVMSSHGVVAGPAGLGGRRIAVFIPGFLSGFGGAEKVAGQLAGLLARNGAHVDVVCIRPPDWVRPYQLESGVELQILERYGDETRLASRRYELMIGFGMPGFYRRIPAIAEALGVPFVIQECTNPEAMQSALASSLSLELDQEARWLRQAVLAHAAAARFTTPAYAATVHPDIAPFAYGFYNAFGTRGGAAASAPARKIICVGALKNKNKNGLAAAEAFAAFARHHPGWSLHFYGENNFPAALDRLRSASPGAVIVDEGLVKDVDRIYADAAMLVIPSLEEGLPNVVVEALTYGVPCIGFDDCSGVKHLIVNGKTGFLVSRSNPEALPSAIARLAIPEVRRELSANALTFAAAELGIEAWEKSWLGLIHNALAGADGQGRPAAPPAGRSDAHSPWRTLLATYALRG